jgi:hypothetical protein
MYAAEEVWPSAQDERTVGEVGSGVLLADLPKTLVRRWYVTLGGLLLTAALCATGIALIPPTQQIDSSILLLPPRTTIRTVGNPYLGLGGLKQPVDVLVKALSAQSAVEAVKQRWPGVTYEAMPDYSTSGPILILTVEGNDEVQVLAASEFLRELARTTLDDLQANLGVRPSARIITTVLTKDEKPKIVRKTQIRALVVLIGGGLMLTMLVAGAVDTLLTRRKRSPSEQASIEPSVASKMLDTMAEESTVKSEIPDLASTIQGPDEILDAKVSPPARDWDLYDNGERNQDASAEDDQRRQPATR